MTREEMIVHYATSAADKVPDWFEKRTYVYNAIVEFSPYGDHKTEKRERLESDYEHLVRWKVDFGLNMMFETENKIKTWEIKK